MYTDFYGFREKPFNIVPDPGYLYLSPKHRTALTYLQYGIREGTGFIMLTGEVGIGKTTLLKHLLGQLETNIEVAVIFNTNVSADQLLEMILSEFELEPGGSGKTQYLHALNEFLIHKYGLGHRALLIIDEAQNLTEEALEGIRMLCKLHSSKDLLLQILLVGQPNLQEKLKDPSLYQLRQRIAVRYHLERLGREELTAYIVHRINVAGGRRDIFTASALDTVYKYAEGIPRKANILCDAALVYGFADELETIDEGVIDQVVEDHQNTGLFGADGAFDSLESEETVSREELDLAGRIKNLEEQVMRLSSMVGSQVSGSKEDKRTDQEELVKKLTSMLEQERNKYDQLLKKYNKLLDRLKKQASPKATTTPKETAAPTGGPKGVPLKEVKPATKIDGKAKVQKEQDPEAVPQNHNLNPLFPSPYVDYKEVHGKKPFPRSILNWFKPSKK